MDGGPTVRLVEVKVRHSKPRLLAGSHSQTRARLGFRRGWGSGEAGFPRCLHCPANVLVVKTLKNFRVVSTTTSC